MPVHLLLPLAASILFVLGLLVIKRVTQSGDSPWMVTLLANLWAALLFSPLWLLGGTLQPPTLLWQPAIVAVLYIMGQVFTFYAVSKGDVSVAAPVLGLKVIMVAVLATVVTSTHLPPLVWLAAGIATVGIALVQWSARRGAPGPPLAAGSTRAAPPQAGADPQPSQPTASRPHHPLWTIGFAAASAAAFALFDVLVQTWAPPWGSGRFLPLVFWIVGILSLGFLPFLGPRSTRPRTARRWLLGGTLLIALQAICMVFALSQFGDATRVNVVYALRGMWSVALAWWIAVRWGGNEAHYGRRVMLTRLAGAVLLTAAVVAAVVS
ncbi:DMT family transporter [Roseimaritima sediminicola]|uniref:DMT family transporter n=1 Tax=Roseimaritima sediminicola TaxID=2662066 RepID=UPI001386C63C|nr:DMT family transporter [Roseimaritima sediminicola]